MAAYKPTMSYRLIYIFTIHDAQHEGYWKIGKTNFDSVNSYKQLPPNCAELNCAARDRIDQYTKTAMVEYDLQYTELARRTVTFPDGTTDTELFDDDDVHNVLYNSGFSARKFSNSNQDSEWFEVPLSVAIRAIQAVKEGRTALTAAEKSEGQIILFIDELHLIVGAGKTDGAMDAGNLLKPMLSAAGCPCCAQKESYYPA